MSCFEERTATRIIDQLSNIGTELKKLNENIANRENHPENRQIINDLIESNLPEATREFLLLTRENPTLPIIPLVDHECVGEEDDTHIYWISKIGRSEIRYLWYSDGNFVFKDEAPMFEKTELDGRWTKAIIVYITPG